jgi:hypothetical protein
MNAPKFEIFRIQANGKPAVELVIHNAPEPMRDGLDLLGYKPTPDIANRRSIICTTPAEVDAARDPIRPYFDDKGEWKGEIVDPFFSSTALFV